MEKQKLPVLTTRGLLIYPKQSQTLEVGREKSKQSLQTAISDYEGKIVIVSQTRALEENPTIEELYKVGTVSTASLKKE